jgi:hypothetical protein
MGLEAVAVSIIHVHGRMVMISSFSKVSFALLSVWVGVAQGQSADQASSKPNLQTREAAAREAVTKAVDFTGFPASRVRTTDGVQAVVVSVDSVELPTAFFKSHGIERLWSVTFDSVLLTEGVRDSALGRRVDKTVARTFTVLTDSATGCLLGAVSHDWAADPPNCRDAWSELLGSVWGWNGVDIPLPRTPPAVPLAEALTVGFDLPVSLAEGIYAFYLPWIVPEDGQRMGLIPGDTAAVWMVVTGHCTAGRAMIHHEEVPCPGFACLQIDAMTGKPVGIAMNQNIGFMPGGPSDQITKPVK